MKPPFCLGIPFPEIQSKNPGNDQHHDNQGIPDSLPPLREDEEYQDGYRNEENDDIQFNREAVEFPPEIVFGFLIHRSYVASGIKVLDVSPHIVLIRWMHFPLQSRRMGQMRM